MNKLPIISILFLVGYGLVFARPSGAIMCGEKTEKTLKYEKKISRVGYFYDEDVPVFREVIPGKNVLIEISDLKTEEDVRKRFEKNKETYGDLLRWRMPFDDFCKSGNRWQESIALVDIQAKEHFLQELLSPRIKKLAPNLAQKQFEMSLEIVADIFSEAEGVSPEKSYRPIFELRGEGLGYANLPQAMAKFLYVRQKHLEKIREKILLRERDELLYWSSGAPEKMREYFAPLKNAARWKQKDVPVSEDAWIGRLDHEGLYPLLCFIGMEPMSDELRARIPALQKSLHDYWTSWWKPDTGGRGSGM